MRAANGLGNAFLYWGYHMANGSDQSWLRTNALTLILAVVGVAASWYISAHFTGKQQYNLGISAGRAQVDEGVKAEIREDEVNARASELYGERIGKMSAEHNLAIERLNRQRENEVAEKQAQIVALTSQQEAEISRLEANHQKDVKELESALETERATIRSLNAQLDRALAQRIFDAIYNRVENFAIILEGYPEDVPDEVLSEVSSVLQSLQTARRNYAQISDAFNGEATALFEMITGDAVDASAVKNGFVALARGRKTKETLIDEAVAELQRLAPQPIN